MVKSLGVKRHPSPSCQSDLYQITPTPPEDEKIARMRVAPETFLDLQRQSVHAAAHVAHATRQPDPNTGRNRDHRPPSAATTRRSVRPSTSRSTRSRQPFVSSISISPSGRSTKPHDGGRASSLGRDGYRHKACRLAHAKSTLAVLTTPSEQQAAADPMPLRHRRYRAARPRRLLHQSQLIRHAPAPAALHPGNHLDPAAHDRPYP